MSRRFNDALGYEQIDDLSSAVGLTVPPGATVCLIGAKDQAVRWRDDGTDPSATVGMPLAVDTEFLYGGDLSAIKFFEAAAGAELNISYYI